MCVPVTFLLVAFGSMCFAIYYGAIMAGWWKEPLLADFRVYGTERKVYPLPRFLRYIGVFCLLGAWLPVISAIAGFGVGVFGLLTLLGSFLVERNEEARAVLPFWYSQLLKETTRQERRAIAWAWLRLPFRTRMRLNGDQYAWRIFVDEIRMTIIYGARDRDDPWQAWQ